MKIARIRRIIREGLYKIKGGVTFICNKIKLMGRGAQKGPLVHFPIFNVQSFTINRHKSNNQITLQGAMGGGMGKWEN